MKKNTPVKRLLKDYINKKSGRVTVSRDELERRVSYLDFPDQKRIVMAFLESCPTDRRWACRCLMNFWDKSFAPKVKEMWERYHEMLCGWVVMKHLPDDYVLSQIDLFPATRDYYFASLRLYNHPDYVLNKAKFKGLPIEYLHIKSLQGGGIDVQEACSLLWGMIKDMCGTFPDKRTCTFAGFRTSHWGVAVAMSARSFVEIDKALRYLAVMKCSEVLDEFAQWDEQVKRTFEPNQQAPDVEIETELEYETKCRVLALKLLTHMRNLFPEQYADLPRVTRVYKYRVSGPHGQISVNSNEIVECETLESYHKRKNIEEYNSRPKVVECKARFATIGIEMDEDFFIEDIEEPLF